MKVNFFKIFGCAFIVTCIVAIGFYLDIVIKAKKNKIESESSEATSETENFNAVYTSYEGKNTGSQVKELISILIENAIAYEEYPDKVPDIKFDNTSDSNKFLTGISITYIEESLDDYITACNEILSNIELEHDYIVKMDESSYGLINNIRIYYDYDGYIENTSSVDENT